MTGPSLHEILLFLAPLLAGSVHVTWASQVVPREAFAFLNQRNKQTWCLSFSLFLLGCQYEGWRCSDYLAVIKERSRGKHKCGL